MKKILAIIMCLSLLLALTACTSENAGEVTVTVAPDEGAGSGAESGADAEFGDMPSLDGENAITPAVDPSDYSYVPFTLESSGFYMEVPAHWERQPASKSVCFTEPVEDGAVPGRIVVTSKNMSYIGDNTRDSQLRGFFANILKDFDTYEWTDVYTDKAFMGDSEALWVNYGGTRDGLAYKGYVILGVKDSTIYVYHFRCAADRYDEMEDIAFYVRDSITFK